MVGISLQNVSKSFGQTVAVDGISFDVRRGELFFLLGPSGCGKTTILRTVAGFCEPDRGSVLFDGRPVNRMPAHKRNTAMVFQSYALWPHMPVRENVAYGLRERKVSAKDRTRLVAMALESVRMDAYADRMPNQLSGGQQQRVALARALVIEPDAVLLDEPLSNLDAQLRLEMRHEIRRIHDETGITMLYVTHDQKEALSMADRIAVMSMGRIEQTGEPRQVYRHPANRFVANFIGETNLIRGVLVGIDGEWCRVSTDLGQFRAPAPDGGGAAGQDVELMIRPECLRLGLGGENTFRATIASSVYLGEIEQFVLETGGRLLRAVATNPGEQAPSRGGAVDMHFEPSDAVLLKAERTGGGA